MYPGFDIQSRQPFARGKKLENQHMIPASSLTIDGFNTWWQKTFALHTAMTAEASALMRTHRRDSAASRARAGQTH